MRQTVNPRRVTRYVDLHCDSLTACLDGGEDLYDFSGHVSLEKLKKSGCAMQCFAIFTDGAGAEEKFQRALALYQSYLKRGYLHPVLNFSDYVRARRAGRIASLLTVENLGFTHGDVSRIAALRDCGVRMASLVWNRANEYARPNLVFCGGVPLWESREKRGLTERGRRAVEELNRNRIILDVSHLSDGGVEEALALSRYPVVASHSDCNTVCPVCRNLTDEQIKKIADRGGVIGVNFHRRFVGGGEIFEGLLRHIRHVVSVGGEDAVALGSDFDGIPTVEGMENCLRLQPFFSFLTAHGLPRRVLEKMAERNFLRVLREVVG